MIDSFKMKQQRRTTDEGVMKMELTWQTFLIVCPMVFLAGVVDSAAGGGGLISLPAYMLAGVPVHNAIATNKLSSCIGTAVSAYRYWKNKYVDWFLAIPSIIAALIFSSLGAKLSLITEESLLKALLVIVLPIAAYFVLKNKNMDQEKVSELTKGQACILAILISVVIGTYDGFYGPGTGTFLILLFTGICKMDIKTASGNTKMVNLASNLAALITFIVNGKILVILGLVSAVFCMAGHYVGSGLVIKQGTKVVRPIILIVLALLFIKVIDWQSIVNFYK